MLNFKKFIIENSILYLTVVIPLLSLLAINIVFATPNCNDGLTYFDGGCYDCDGILYKRVGGNIVCITCVEGFEYDGQEGCIQKAMPQERDVGNILDKLSSRISPQNPLIGFAILLLIFIIIFNRLYKKKFR